MILVNDFNKFLSIISDIAESSIQYKMFGSLEESSSVATVGFSASRNDTLSIKLLAMTTIGTFYCICGIDLSDTETVQKAKQLFEDPHLSEAHLTYPSQSGVVTIS